MSVVSTMVMRRSSQWLGENIVQNTCKLFTKGQNFILVQIESICRLQNKRDQNIEIYSGKGRKHCCKRRKCWLPAFSPLPTFSKGFFSQGH